MFDGAVAETSAALAAEWGLTKPSLQGKTLGRKR
jgi:hypothetical protein